MKKRSWVKTATYFGLSLWTVLALFPYYFALATSFKTKRDLFEPTRLLFSPTLDNYNTLFTASNFLLYMKNSAIVTIGSVVPSIILGIMCAYGLARLKMRKERTIAVTILSMRMVPAIAVVIPFFLLGQMAGLIDTPWILILAYMSMNIPLAVWLLRGFFRDIPTEIDEAAALDGASHWRTLWSVIVPMSWSSITTTAVLLLIQTWNEFVFAQFLTATDSRTVPTSVGLFLSIAGTDFGQMGSAVIVGTAPVLVFALIARKRLTTGLSYGSL